MKGILLTTMLFLSSFVKVFSQNEEIPVPKCAIPPNVLETLKDAKDKSEIDFSKIKNLNSTVLFTWPIVQASGYNNPSFWGISNYIDHNSTYGDLQDYNCGTRTYDVSGYNHTGTDIFPAPFGWTMMDNQEVDIVAAADGIIIYKADGNYDRNCDFSNPNWNAIYVRHADNTVTMYGHMKNGSLTSKVVGATVSQGEFLGKIGSSGNSTGPHLHFEVYDSNYNTIDPWSGSCNPVSSKWITQKPYNDSGLLRVMTHSAPPSFGTSCGVSETTNQKTTFNVNEVVYGIAYFRTPRSGQSAQMKVYDSNNSLIRNFTIYLSDYDYWAYYWQNFTIPSNATSGTWKIETTYMGQTNNIYFNVIGCTQPMPPTTTSANRCGTGSVTLSASGCSGTYNWYATSSGGTSLASTVSYTTPSISATTNYYVDCTVGSCTSSRTAATATINAVPTAPTLSASPTTITSGQNSTLSASNCSGTVTWSNSLGTGTSKSVSPTATTTYTATCTVNGCTSSNGSVTVNTCNLSAPTTTSTNRCGTGSVTLSASGCLGTYNWYSASSGGTSLASTANYTTPSISSTTNYYVDCIVGSCTSSRTAATATINAVPTAPTLSTSPTTITTGQSSTLSASNCSGTVTWSNSLGTGTSKTVSPTTTTTYTATCSVNGCTSNSASITVTVNVSNPCPNTITHSGNIATGTYSAAQTIISTANVATNTNYFATNSITMNPGFSAGGNETFIAKIQNCNPPIPTSGMVAYLPFNNNLMDESGNGNNGEFHGGKYTFDRFGNDKKSIYFGGTEISQGYTGYALIPNSNSLIFSSDFSISIWVSVKTYSGMSIDNNGYIINSQDGIHTLFSKGGINTGFIANIKPKSSVDSVFYGFKNDISFGVNNFELVKSLKGISNTINKWIHLTYIVQSSILKIYKNGVLINSKIVNSPIDINVMNSNAIRLGVVPPNEGLFPLNGSLDDLRIYNRALSDAEVQALYNAEKP